MENIKHFASMIRQHGNPQIPTEQFRRMLNIIYIEAKLKAYREVKENVKGSPQANKWDVRIMRLNQLLKALTGNVEPKALVYEMSTGRKAHIPPKEQTPSSWPEHDIYESFNKRRS